MIIFSTADWHIDNNKDFFKSLEFFVNQVEHNQPDLVTIAGDLFDKAQLNTETSGFVKVQKQIIRILNVCPISAIYGTPSHDISGSLKVFENLKAKYEFSVLTPGKWNNYICRDFEISNNNEMVQITGIPEINKAFYLTEEENATPEEINKALDGFLMGLRTSKNNTIPSIVLFHGEIKGSKLNENQVLPGGGISLTENALLTLDADYYSCGHIHMRQEINSKIRYEGSMYNKNWGERTKKAFTVIEITIDNKMELSEVEFPTQPMEKIKVSDVSESLYSKDMLPSNTKLWCEVEVSEEDYKAMSQEDIKNDYEQLMSYGYGDGSRVTYTIVKNETTRASEIVETRSLYEKFMIWVRNSNVDYEMIDIVTIQEACEHYESNLKELGIFNEQRSLALKSLSLKGSIGIWKGMNKELYEIDLMDMGSGIVALLGDNGSGKSTIIKNCNPYPDPIDGGQGLKNMFFLKDSHSITVWEDHTNGCNYKCIKKINAISGKSEFFVMADKDGAGWKPYNSDQNGRKEPYKKAILEIFGSDEIFKRSVYIAQKGSSLPQSVSERKALFNELLGNQYLEKIHEMVKTDISGTYEDIEKIDNKLEILEETKIDKPGLERSIRLDESLLLTGEEDIQILTTNITELKKKRDYYSGIKDKMYDEKLKLNGCEKDISQLQEEHIEKSSKIVDLEQLLKKENDTKVIIDHQENAKTKIKEVIEQIESIDVLINDNQEELHIMKQNMSERDTRFSKEKNDWNLEFDLCQKHIDNSSQEIIELKNKIKYTNENESCEKCGHIPGDVEKRLLEYNELITSNESVISINTLKLNGLKVNQTKLEDEYIEEYTKLKEKFKLLSRTIEGLKDKKKQYDNDKKNIHIGMIPDNEYQIYRDQMNVLATAKNDISEYQKRLVVLDGRLSELDESLKSHELKIESMIKEVELLTETEHSIDVITEKLIEKEKLASTLKSNIENNKAILETNAGNLEKITLFKETKDKLKAIFRVQSIIKSGTGKDGIQALELDALTPAILDTANKLLTSIYGDKFSLSVETTRETTKGEQVEDFEIVVTDNEEENFAIKTQKLSTLSGGEEVWILKAIYDAFAIVGEKNTGLKYLTTFQDEADGALSPDKKHLYLRMIEASHNETNRYHTIYVTHDQGIQELIKQKIYVGSE